MKTATLSQRISVGLVVVATGAFVTDIAVQIRNACFAKDPFTDYVPLARQLVANDWSLDIWKSISGWMAPGYPGLLAAAIEIFGDFAPMWINVGFAWLWIVLLAMWIRCWTESILVLAGGLLGWWLFLVLGYVNNAHFALYAYRHLPCMCFILLAWICCASRRPGIQWLTGLVLLFGLVVRETTMLAVPGLVSIMVLLSLEHDRGQRLRVLLKRAGRCLGPLAVCAVLGLLVLPVNNQVEHLWELVSTGRNFSPGVVGIQALAQISWPGWLGLALALVAAVWSKSLRLCSVCFLSAALGFVLVYSFTKWSPRYPFCVVFWLGPIAGMGLVYPLTKIPALRDGRQSVALALLVLVALGLHLGHRKSVLPFFPVVTAGEVKTFVSDISAKVPAEELLIIDRQSSLAGATVGSYLPHPSFSGVDSRLVLKSGERCHYLLPINQAAIAGKKMKRGAADWELVRRTCDMDPGPTIRLGPAEFGLFAVEPFSQHTVSKRFEPSRSAAWAMLDFRDVPLVVPPKLGTRSDSETAPLHLSRQPVQFLPLPPRDKPLELVCEAGVPLPKDWCWMTFPADQPIKIDLDRNRPLSSLIWFKQGWWKKGHQETYGVALLPGHKANLVLPVPGANQRGRLGCSLVFLPGQHPCPAGRISWRTVGSEAWVDTEFPAAARNVAIRLEQDYALGQHTCAFQVLLHTAQNTPLELRVATVFFEFSGHFEAAPNP